MYCIADGKQHRMGLERGKNLTMMMFWHLDANQIQKTCITILYFSTTGLEFGIYRES